MTTPDFSRPVLAIDTSTAFLSLALHADGQWHGMHTETGNRQSDLILPGIRSLLSEAACTVFDLGAIVYAQGAGAFTGLRIGIGVAQGLAAPFGIPLVGIPCLDVVAYQIPDCECVLAATDARMGEVFYAWFDTRRHERLSAYGVGKAEEITLPESCQGRQVAGAGNAFALEQPPTFAGQPLMPTAADYLRLAQSGRYPATAAEHANLLYIRDKVALTAAEQLAKKVQAAF